MNVRVFHSADSLLRAVGAAIIAAGCSAAAVTPASAATVLYDLGYSSDGSLYTDVDGTGRHWNVINTWSAGQRGTNAVNAQGEEAFIDWHTDEAFGFYVENGTDESTLYPATATRNGLQLTSSSATAQVRIAGLIAGNSYDFTFFGAREQDRVAITFTINDPAGDGSAGPASQTLVNSWNVDDTVTFADVVAQNTGEVVIDLSVPDATDPNTGFAYNQGIWSVLQIDGTFVPEPTSLLLTAAGSLVLLRRTRSTSQA